MKVELQFNLVGLTRDGPPTAGISVGIDSHSFVLSSQENEFVRLVVVCYQSQ